MSARPEALLTERLALTPLDVEHARALFGVLCDPEVYRYSPHDPPQAVSDLEARYRRTGAGPSAPDERWWNWAVAERAAPGAPFGTVELSLRDGGACADLAYVFGRPAWGRGIAFEACSAALAYAVARAGTRRIEAQIDTRNVRSIRLAERLGMRRFETVLAADYFKGSTSDEYHFCLSPICDEENDAQA